MKPELIWILGTALGTETASVILIVLIGIFILLATFAVLRQKRGQGGFFRHQPGAWSLVQPFEE
jgi:hypothetical protein